MSALPNVVPMIARRPRPRRAGGQYLEPGELIALLKVARQRGVRDWAMILVAYRHGLRASEVCNLRLSDVDLKNGCLTVQRLKGSLKTTQPLHSHKGQPLLDEISALKLWLRERPSDGTAFLFVSQKGGALDRTSFFRAFRALALEAGLPASKAHPHALKHSLGTHLVSANVNLALVKQSLGHRSLSSTQVYLHPNDAQAGEASRRALAEIF